MGELEGSSATNSLMSASLRENDTALTVLENLEHYWFWDNVFNFQTGSVTEVSGSFSSFTNSMIVGSCPNLEALMPSPFRSVEMVAPKATNMRDRMEVNGNGELPKPYLQRSCSAFEERELDKDFSHSLLDASLYLSRKICCSSEHVVGEESKHDRSSSSSTEVSSEQLPIVPRFPKLETIFSDKQLQERKPEMGIQQTTVRRRERRRATRSMTDLECDEVRGFMDLGFEFNVDELNPHVVSVLPGLQRLGGQGKIQRHAQPPTRPYLSEAWLIRRPDSPLLNWRIPSFHGKEVDMKKQLKFWARAVASTVQQES